MHPNIHVNWWAVVASVVASFLFGGLWHELLFGKTMLALMGRPVDFKPAPNSLRKSLAIHYSGTLVTAYILTYSLKVWMPTAWGLGPDGPRWMYGAYCAVFTWLGFFVPLQLNNVAWEYRPWKMFFISAGHDFINLQIMCQILAHWQ